VKICIRGCP